MRRISDWISNNGLTDRSLILTIFVFTLSIGVSIVSQAIVGNSLGLENFGRFSSIYARVTILSGLLTWGFDISALKFVSFYFQSGNTKELRRFAVYSIFLTVLGTLAFTIVWSFAYWMGWSVLAEFTPIMVLATIFWTITRLLAALLRASGMQVASLVVDRIVRDGLLAAFCLWMILGPQRSATLTSVVDALAISCAIALVFSILTFAFGNKPVENQKNEPISSRRLWFTTSLSLWGANILELTFSRAEVILLAFYGQATNAGLFAVLLAVSNLLLLPVLALNVVFQPRFAALNSPGGGQKLRQEARRFVLSALPITLLIGAVVLIQPKFFLALFGAHEIASETLWCLVALVVFRMALAPIGARAPILQMNDGHLTLAAIYALGVFLKTALLLSAISTGSLGWVTGISIASTLLIQLLIYISSIKLLNRA